MANFTKTLGQVGFGMAVVTSLMPPWFLCIFGQLYVQSGNPDAKEEREMALARWVTMLTCLCWRAALSVCWWVRQDLEGVPEMRAKIGNSGRPVCVIGNHSSFMDIFVSVAAFPLRTVSVCKMIVSSHVFDMPLIGRICSTMQHLAVPFKDTSATSTNFEVDKEALVVVMENYEAHLKAGKACAWFPEGQVNKGDCSKLQTFRAGGMGIAVRSDVEIWSMAFVGHAVTWPKRALIGGYPAHMGGRIKLVCESSKAWLSEQCKDQDERAQSLFLANTTQKMIQADVDEFVEKGYKAGDNTGKGGDAKKLE
mmetsp:Transcript_88118/g.189166  ORF Transcript_88118/g.189166 Transcript_88118/m.189166 type:complete len:309 (-) Transcript_88118:62-988(-)